jgi:predicted nucleic acid-binding protein
MVFSKGTIPFLNSRILREFPLETTLEEVRRDERNRENERCKDYVLDANAVIRHFGVGDGQGGEKVRDLFEQAERNHARLFMSVINLGEVLYVLLKQLGEQRAFQYIQALQPAVTLIDADANRTTAAATLKHQYKIGYADSFAASLAIAPKATLVSADPSFEKIGKSLKWMRLPKFDPKNR